MEFEQLTDEAKVLFIILQSDGWPMADFANATCQHPEPCDYRDHRVAYLQAKAQVDAFFAECRKLRSETLARNKANNAKGRL